jgi:Sulfotransferase domain
VDDNFNTISLSTNGSQSLPSFFVIGPPRTGTSWVHDVLNQYTSLPNHVKETRFFDLHFNLGLDWYLRYFSKPGDTGKPRGEVAPTYFASAKARERLARTFPCAKVICIFRHPVERALSLYRLKLAYGMIRCSFEDAVLFDPELLESGKYATHLKSWYHAIGSTQVSVTFYDQLRDRSHAYIDHLADFIGIRRFELTGAQKRLVHPSEGLTQPRNFMFTRIGVALANRLKAGHWDRIALALRNSALGRTFLSGGDPFAPVSPTILRAVLDMFRPEVEGLETMLNVDLSAWKSAQAQFETSLIDEMILASLR